MFRIKICGITSVADARAVAEAGADAIGLNFYARSPRFIEPELAKKIADSLPRDVALVGVFVNAPSAQVCEIYDRLRLTLVQLHGDEPPEFLAQLGGRPVMRAFRCQSSLDTVGQYLDHCAELGCSPASVLMDGHSTTNYGGTGTPANLSLLDDGRGMLAGLPVVWAGGLSPENVAGVIARIRPAAVDVASGVEHTPGRKSPPLIQAFVEAARRAFNELDGAASQRPS